MSELQIFASDQFGTIRTIDEMGTVLFCGSDVARALGYLNPSKALSDHCKGVTKRYTLTDGGKQLTNFIPEGDVYRLITHSKLPAAEKFERWVFEEVLPSIRKTGNYSILQTPQRTLTPDDYIKAASIVAACRNERLPYVLGLLRTGGWDIPEVEETDRGTAAHVALAAAISARQRAYFENMHGLHGGG